MSGIYKVDISNEVSLDALPYGSIQRYWATNNTACYKPTSIEPYPIICAAWPASYHVDGETSSSDLAYGQTLEQEQSLYQQCCPTTFENGETNVHFLSQPGCSYFACLTGNVPRAESFSKCVMDLKKTTERNMRGNGTIPANATISVGGYGQCEYIDPKALKSTTASSGSDTRQVLSLQGLGTLLIGVIMIIEAIL